MARRNMRVNSKEKRTALHADVISGGLRPQGEPAQSPLVPPYPLLGDPSCPLLVAGLRLTEESKFPRPVEGERGKK